MIFGSGRQTRDFTFVEDTVEGLVRAAACDTSVGETVNIAFGGEVSIRRIAELVAKQLGRDDVAIDHTDARPGDVDRHYADIEKARRLFGYRPLVDLETGLVRTIAWFREQGIAARGEAGAPTPNW